MARISLLTAIDSTSHVHLIVGSNSLAGARCAKSLEVGAKPLLIAPGTAELHHALQKRIDDGEVKWLAKSFEDEDVFRLGREDIGRVVDAVFVTSGPRDPSSQSYPRWLYTATNEIRCTHFPTLQKKPNTRQCIRCSNPVHV
jgi:uroporphyrin-III C-methyltransferase